ncbi:MAG TPA: hypothetical protein P5298_01085 [Spirochaetia bacterium]|nr:hypothetical protein [Spirochaetales bacterium]HRW22988.1 hypothetical protein [Spirochaetia bacterium]
MKRFLIILIAVCVAVGAFAQGTTVGSGDSGRDKVGNAVMESDLYPVRVDVSRVYSHAQGYRVVYRKGATSFAEVYIPVEWFVAGGKGVLLRGTGPQYPYMVVYYRPDGSFSHVKLFVLANMRDASWGVIEGDPGDRFKVDTIKLEF